MSEKEKKKEDGEVSVGGGVITPSGTKPTIFAPPGTDFKRVVNYLSSLGASQTPKFGAPGLLQERYTREADQVLGAADTWAAGESPWQDSWRFWTGQEPRTTEAPGLTAAQRLAQQDAFQRDGRGAQDRVYGNREAQGEEVAPTDWLAQAMSMVGGGPDYSAYRASLEDMVLNPQTGLSPRLQAMYNQLAEQAGMNQQRIADIYDGATENVGDVYDTSAANVGDAFSSAQQQAADQMARLGIEQAAEQVIPQAAGRQASALSALEQGRAGGLSALERYGASSGDFASQMGQAAQQRGVEQNEFLLGALQRQLADSLGMEAQGSYDARLRAPGLARDLYEASQIGQAEGPSFDQQIALERLALEQGQAGADVQLRAQQNRNERYQQLFEFYNGDAQKAQEQVLFEIEQGLI